MTDTKNTTAKAAATTTTAVTTAEAVRGIEHAVQSAGPLKGLLRAAGRVVQVETGLATWALAAGQARAAGISTREWAERTGTSANAMTRLVRTAHLLAAYEHTGQHVSPAACYTFASASTTTDAVMAETLKGIRGRKSDPVNARAAKALAAKKSGVAKANASRKGKPNAKTAAERSTVVTPDTYAKVLTLMAANVAKVSDAKVAETLDAARVLLSALEDRAADTTAKSA